MRHWKRRMTLVVEGVESGDYMLETILISIISHGAKLKNCKKK